MFEPSPGDVDKGFSTRQPCDMKPALVWLVFHKFLEIMLCLIRLFDKGKRRGVTELVGIRFPAFFIFAVMRFPVNFIQRKVSCHE